MKKDAKQRLSEVAALWNRIEVRTKEIEQFREEAVIAAINEMRYAGRRIVDVLTHAVGGKQDPDFNEVEQIAVAKAYLLNADHDLTDAAIFYAHRRIKRLERRYKERKLCALCPLYEEMLPEIRKAQEIVKTSRGDRPTRRADYQNLADVYVPRLIQLHHQLWNTPGLILPDEDLKRWVQINTGLTVIASISSIVGCGLGVWGLWLIFNPPAG